LFEEVNFSSQASNFFLEGDLIMKLKVLLVLLAFAVMVVAGFGVANAAVGGVCSSCHTMHDSQGGADQGAAGPQAHLLLNTCIGCHTDNTLASGTADVDAGNLAGGGFDTAAAPSTQHNVTDFTFSTPETVLQNTTPGDNVAGTGPTGSAELTCAGALGCHGTHNTGESSMQGIAGFHHESNGIVAYRFLTITDGVSTNAAVLGEASADREQGGATAANHNVYSADATTGISSLCGMCHGTFHDSTQNAGEWIRHPTDQAIPGTWTPTVDYNNNPFGFANLADADPTTPYTATNASVVCVSCHRAHGTANDDILRFDYATQVAGGGATAGCLGCHDSQR